MNEYEKIGDMLSRIKHVALDMDGTIYKGGTLFPFTIEFLRRLRAMGIGYSFLTNNPSKSMVDYLEHLRKMGIDARPEQMYTSARATIEYIKHNYPQMKRLFILGTPSMIAEFEREGFVSTEDDPADCPDGVVASFDMSLVYSRLCRASWWVTQGLPYVATNPDWVCPTDLPMVLVDCGSICAAIEKATGRKPDVVIGKPDARMLDGILVRYGLRPDQVAMVGDRIYTDVQMAINAGALGVLTLTGEATMDDVARSPTKPDLVVDTIDELAMLLEKVNN